MSVRARSRPVALLLSLVPGWGHVYWGRELGGLGIFTVFAVSGFCLLNGLFIYIGAGRSALITISTVAILAGFFWNWISILRLTSPRRVQAQEQSRLASLRDGMTAYLRGEVDASRAAFEACVEADPIDIEALFRLGVVCARTGDAAGARRWLKRAAKHDLDDKWRWELDRELARLKAASGLPKVEPHAASAPAHSRADTPEDLAIQASGSRPKTLQPPAPS